MPTVIQRGFILAGLIVALVFGVVWATVAWVPADGGLWVWSASSGTLRVPEGGLAVIPRWSGKRLEKGLLAAEVRATTVDGAKVGVTVELQPPVGVWRLQPAETPHIGLRTSVADTVRVRPWCPMQKCVIASRRRWTGARIMSL